MSFYHFGEDSKYDIYKKDSDVYTDKEDPEQYIQLLEQKQEFSVSGFKNKLYIKKGTLEKLLLLSECDPIEHVLFSLNTIINKKELNNYPISKPVEGEILDNDKAIPNKTMKLRSGRKPNKKQKIINNKGPNTDDDSSNDSDPLRNGDNEKNGIKLNVRNQIPNPLSQKSTLISSSSNNSENKEKDNNQNGNIINIPQPSGDYRIGSYVEQGEINIALSSNAVVDKWFYLILVICGICDIAYFIYIMNKPEIILGLCLYFIGGFGLYLIFNGFYGFCQIKARIYNNVVLLILTILAILGAFASLILFRLNAQPLINGNIFPSIIANVLTIIFALICIILTHKLKVEDEKLKTIQSLKLIDDTNKREMV